MVGCEESSLVRVKKMGVGDRDMGVSLSRGEVFKLERKKYK